MAIEPQNRANVLKVALKHLETLPHDTYQSVMSAFDPAALKTIQEAGRTQWVSVTCQHAINEALAAVGGETLLRDFWRSYGSIVLESPIYRSILDGAFRVFGVSPKGLLRSWALGHRIATRHQGVVRCDQLDGENKARVSFLEVPAEVTNRLWAVAQEGSVYAALDLTKTEGDVTSDMSKLSEGTLRITIEWR